MFLQSQKTAVKYYVKPLW